MLLSFPRRLSDASRRQNPAPVNRRTLVSFLSDKTRGFTPMGNKRCSPADCPGYNPRIQVTLFPRPAHNRTGPRPVTFRAKTVIGAVLMGAATFATALPAHADAQLLLEADTGKVLYADNANYPWYPASLTKLMTLYVTLQAMRERRITRDTMIAVSARAASQAPAKMGFKAGTQLTLDNALKMLMVKSANDMAVTIAEGISGSVENFSGEMNSTAQRLGMV